MNEHPVINSSLPEHLHSLASLAYLLERLERSPLQVSADQYRLVALRLRDELADARLDARLDALLRAYPAASEMYENLQYERAGLCRCALDASARTEILTKRILRDAAGRTDA